MSIQWEEEGIINKIIEEIWLTSKVHHQRPRKQTQKINHQDQTHQPFSVSLKIFSYSVGLTSLLDPENQSLSKIYEALEKKQKITVDREAKLFQLSPQKSEMETKGRREIPRQMSNRQQPIQGGQDSLQMATREF